MFKIGQDVVCIDDRFPAHIHAIYENLVKEGEVYTIREIDDGVVPIAVDPATKGSFPIFHGLRVQVLRFDKVINKIDPVSKKEPGFASFRFAPLKTDEEEVEETIKVPCVTKAYANANC